MQRETFSKAIPPLKSTLNFRRFFNSTKVFQHKNVRTILRHIAEFDKVCRKIFKIFPHYFFQNKIRFSEKFY